MQDVPSLNFGNIQRVTVDLKVIIRGFKTYKDLQHPTFGMGWSIVKHESPNIWRFMLRYWKFPIVFPTFLCLLMFVDIYPDACLLIRKIPWLFLVPIKGGIGSI